MFSNLLCFIPVSRFSRVEKVFDLDAVDLRQHLKWNNLKENVCVPHAPS